MPEETLTIGELARRTGVAPSALRYYEELGLLPHPRRASGQRRYDPTAVVRVGVILLLRDVGFTLAEIQDLLGASDGRREWRAVARRKLEALDAQIHKAQVARTALEHALRCRHDELVECPNFRQTVASRGAGIPLEHAHAH